jgi:LuxR family maltose regulon positive regulatory protein
VLYAQPDVVRAFVLDTSILDELTPALCATVTGESDAAQLLADVERRNLFLARYVSANGPAWRYHDLFAAFLRDRLAEERDGAYVRALHRRAADALPALQSAPHLLAAGEHDRVARIVVDAVFHSMDPSMLPIVVPWVQALPPEVVERDHRLALVLAWNDEIHGRANQIVARLEPLYTRLRASGASLAAGEVGLELATAYFMRGDLDGEGALLNYALAQPLRGWWRIAALGLRMHWFRDRGDWERASDDLDAAFHLALGGDDVIAHRILASAMSWRLLFADQGPAWVRAQGERLAARLAESGSTASLTELRPLLAGAALLGIDLPSAADETRRCLDASRDMGGLAWTHQKAETLLLVQALLMRDHATVRAVVDGAFSRMEDSPVDVAMQHVYAAAAVRSAWLRGNGEELGAAISRLDDATRPEGQIVLTVAQALRARLRNQLDDGVIERLAEAESVQRRMRCWIGVGLPGLERATLLIEQGRLLAALHAAEPTLAAAAEYGGGILLPEAASHVVTLKVCADAGMYPDVIRAVLAVVEHRSGLSAVAVPGTSERLSSRELEVLTHVARGESNRQIATELFISDVTVKSHLTRIMRKLDATSRTHAVAIALRESIID